ncbi:hypothetical protein CAP35_11380 [Chitinophagaceae bacterium IBVUCB1]|nr:hypothetical protein CAP35_11380 [Chitinophagaceae bacterium IBVUCB1]
MITSSSIQYISQVLAEPQNISDADAESISALIETYPYFVPARYMDAANKHKQEPYNNPMMSAMQLYMNNWLMYCQFLATAMNSDAAIPAQAATETAATAEEVITAPTTAITTEDTDIAADEIIEEPFTVHEEAIADTITEETTPTTPVVAESEAFIQPPPQPIYTQKKAPKQEDEDYQPETDESFILPVYTEDYFLHQGMQVSNNIPTDLPGKDISPAEEAKSLMVVMSFSEWLVYFKKRKEQEQEEVEGQKAVKTMWQKEKLAAALEEENEEIPEKVFEMAVNSITKEDDLASESLAEIHAMQGKYDKAIEMYRKLSLRNPQKKAYFARKIEVLLKDKQS